MEQTLGLRRGEAGIDLDALPAKHVQRRSRIGGWLLMAVGGFFGGIFLFVAVALLTDPASRSGGAACLVFVAVCGLVFVAGLFMASRRAVLTITGQDVGLEIRSLLGGIKWREPLGNYLGVLYETHQQAEQARPVQHGRTVHVLRLEHARPERRVVLYESSDPGDIRARWAWTCQRLGVPAVEKGDDRLQVKDPHDLTKSVVELYQEQKLEAVLDASAYVPGGLEVVEFPDFTEITCLRKRREWLLLGAGIVGLVVSVQAATLIGGPAVGIVGFIFGLLWAVGPAVWALLKKERLRIGKGYVERLVVTPRGERTAVRLETSSIRDVRIGRVAGWFGKAVILDSPAGRTSVGAGLKQEELEWLRDFIVAKLVR